MANPVKFWRGSRASFAALETKSENTLYFLTDENALYRGSSLQAINHKIVTEDPAAADALEGFLYINSTDHSVKYKSGSNLVTLVLPTTTTVASTSTDAQVPTAKAVYDAINSKAVKVSAKSGEAITVVSDSQDNTAKIIGLKLNGTTLSQSADGLKSEIHLVRDTSDSALASKYYLADGNGTKIGDVSIEIQKDQFLKNATLETKTEPFTPEGGSEVLPAGTYIHFEFEVGSESTGKTTKHIYLNVTKLIDVYKGSNTISVAQQASDSSYIISAKLSGKSEKVITGDNTSDSVLYVVTEEGYEGIAVKNIQAAINYKVNKVVGNQSDSTTDTVYGYVNSKIAAALEWIIA